MGENRAKVPPVAESFLFPANEKTTGSDRAGAEKRRVQTLIETVMPPIAVATVFVGIWLVVSYGFFSHRNDQIRNSKKLPTVAVMAPLNKTPLILMDDPSHYHFASLADVGKSGARVLYFEGAAYMDYLVSKGLTPQEPARRLLRRLPDQLRCPRGRRRPAGLRHSRAVRVRAHDHPMDEAGQVPPRRRCGLPDLPVVPRRAT